MAFPDVMHTSNPIYPYPFSWKIDNFDNFLITSLEVQGPTFFPIPGHSRQFRFELAFRKVTEAKYDPDFSTFCLDCENEPCLCTEFVNVLDVKLIDLDYKDASSDPFYVVCNIKLHNEDEIAFSKKSVVAKVEQTTTLASYRDLDISLNYSHLTIEGTLEFSGLGVKSNIHSAPQTIKNREELAYNLKTMYESGLGSDVTFSFGEKKLRAHKAILSCRSPVFAKMFEYDMLENNTNNVTIEDTDSHTFACFLVFLYTGVIQDNEFETLISLYALAHKYQVTSLHKSCLLQLVHYLDLKTFRRVLVLADLYGDEELKGAVVMFVRMNFVDVAGTTTWGELLTTNPEIVHKLLDCIKFIDKGKSS